jgi:hypothetical protein
MSINYKLYYDWILEVGEERLVEHKFLRENFYSREDYIVFLFILMRFSKKLTSEIKDVVNNKSDNELIKKAFPKSNITGDELNKFILQYYENVKNMKHYGVTRRSISLQTNIPRTSVARIIGRLRKSKLVTVTKKDNLIVPTALARKKFTDYRKYIFTSFKRLNKKFNDAHLEDLNPNDPGL